MLIFNYYFKAEKHLISSTFSKIHKTLQLRFWFWRWFWFWTNWVDYVSLSRAVQNRRGYTDRVY